MPINSCTKNGEDEEEEEKEEGPKSDLGMLNKEIGKIFFQTRACISGVWWMIRLQRKWSAKCCCLDADKPGEEIKFYINSPGGVVTSGMVIYDTMRMMKSPVSTICMGLAASMGSILLSGGKKGKRFIYPHGEVMIHQPRLGGHIQGVSADLEIQAKQTQKSEGNRRQDIGGKLRKRRWSRS